MHALQVGHGNSGAKRKGKEAHLAVKKKLKKGPAARSASTALTKKSKANVDASAGTSGGTATEVHCDSCTLPFP